MAAITMISAAFTIVSKPLEVGTRVHWDKNTESLYYVDVPLSQIYKYQPSIGNTTKVTVANNPIGFAFPIEGDDTQFIAGLGRQIVIITWDGKDSSETQIKVVGEVDTEADLAKNRLNGGKVDPFGRLWAGTMGETGPDGNTVAGKGSLYSVTKGVIKKHESNIGISNGLAWNVELKKMYYVDTLFLGVYQYDYDPATGDISNRTVIFKFSDYNISGLPDGLTIDVDGNLWVAVIHGSAIIQIDPKNGKLLKTIRMPTSQITAVTFGDSDLSTLYVNTAKMEVDGAIPKYPAGCTFSLTNLGVKGFPGDRYRK